MKRYFQILTLLLMTGAPVVSSRAQTAEIEELIYNVEKLDALEQILDQMYTTYKVLEGGYSTITRIAEGNYSLHELFIDGLMMVNPSIRNYKRIPFIIEYQKILLQEYQRAYNRFRNDPHFTPEEIQYLGNVYSFLLQASIRNIDDLLMIITATKLSMTDDERLVAVDQVFYDMENKLRFLRSFNSTTQLLAIQRARAAGDVRTMNKLYGVQ